MYDNTSAALMLSCLFTTRLFALQLAFRDPAQDILLGLFRTHEPFLLSAKSNPTFSGWRTLGPLEG